MNLILKLGLILILLNEIRGAIMAGPILYGMIAYGPTWVATVALAAIAISVLIPFGVYKLVKEHST